MREEVLSAANFLTNMLRPKENINKSVKLQRKQLEQFHYTLQDMLHLHYQEHWFPTNPNKGSGYRCIRINHKMDPILSKAGFECGFSEEVLRNNFPHELTMWVDPREVSYRIGENGSICVLYDGSSDSNFIESRPVSSAMEVLNRPFGRASISNSEDDTDSCSSMSVSPPTPSYNPPSTCKGEFRFGNSDFILENRNNSFIDYVAS